MRASRPFVSQVRVRPGTIRVGSPGAEPFFVRVEIPEAWDALLFETSPDTPVSQLKLQALSRLLAASNSDDYVVKLRGILVPDESVSLSQAGALDGSIFLVTSARRRPVR